MKYLITGGAGFIGSHLAEKLIARGDQMVVFDNLSTGSANNLSSIKEMILGFCPESTISNLNFLGAFKTLNKLELNLSGEPNQFQINLPTDLQELEFNTGGVEVDLSFLSNAKNLKYLKLQTDVYNNGKGFKKLDVLGKLEGLEKLILDENAMGANNYKSDFKPKNLSTLKNLKYLVLDGMMNLKDLTDLKGLDRLEYLKIRNSKISSIKGVSELTNLKKFELFVKLLLNPTQNF